MRVLAISMVSLALACGGNTVPQVTTQQACKDLAAAECMKIDQCFPFLIGYQYGDVATCTTRLQLICTPTLMPGVGSHQTPQTTEACATAIGGATCSDIFAGNTPAACVPPAGDLNNGMACGDDSQCMSTYCAKQGGGCGVCASATHVGDACTGSCSRGQTCAGGSCATWVASGGACDDTHPCIAGTACFQATCTPLLSQGATCDPQGALTPPCDLLHGLVCDPVAHSCAMLQLATAGMPCGYTNGQIVGCSAGGRCDTNGAISGTCAAPAADGAACTVSNNTGQDCEAPAACVNNVCRLPTPGTC